MAAERERGEDQLVAVIGDEDTVTGFLLAGVGHRDAEGSNFLVVDGDTHLTLLEDTMTKFLARPDIGIILINQHIANDIRHLINGHKKPIPTIVEVPSKDSPYDSSKDPLMARVLRLLGEGD
mmetsp:Transcript_3121/g.7314  ORF Transcript_3121/g.7314 Transcript_3121/m.7314 type:complete len:122 (-) Transcript_3121:28-393(-)